jgi:cardiolipin synthase
MDMVVQGRPDTVTEAGAMDLPSSAIRATVAGNRLELLEKGSDRLRAILRLIDGAQRSVRLLFYIYHADRSGEAVRDALVRAAERGVKVEVLLDGFGCSAGIPGFFEPLDRSGGKLCLFHASYGRRYLLRNHQKLVVADDLRALIGGANIQDEYLTDEGPAHWRDLWLGIEGPAVAHAANYFDALLDWSRSKRAKLRDLRRLVHRFSQSEGAVQWKFGGPFVRRNPWSASLIRDLRSGSRFDLISAYFSPPIAMLLRIRRLKSKARIVTAAKSDNAATIAAARHTYARLLRRDVQMFEYQLAKLHTKLAIIDDAVHIGSSNFDFRSLYINLELMLRIDDPGFAAAMRGYFERELKACERITAESHKRRANFWRRLQWALSYFLVTSMDYTVSRRLNFAREA